MAVKVQALALLAYLKRNTISVGTQYSVETLKKKTRRKNTMRIACNVLPVVV
jgi:hypothetical protein